ncbi:unnamed protein product [Adineta ricciae]|nr:unnamed protein product [Adineta ricciae]
MVARISALLNGANVREFCYWTILGRLDQFIIGMIAAQVVRNLTIDDKRLGWGLLIGIPGMFMALFIFNRSGGWLSTDPWKIVWPPVEALLWGLIIVGYLVFMNSKENILLRAISSIVLPITISISTLSYHAIEKPFLELRHSYLMPTTHDNIVTDCSSNKL